MKNRIVYLGAVFMEGHGVEVFFDPDLDGGEFCFPSTPKGHVQLRVGNRRVLFSRVLGYLVHELHEFAFVTLGYRYHSDKDQVRGSQGSLFLLSHDKLCETHMEVGSAILHILPALRKAWRQSRRKKA